MEAATLITSVLIISTFAIWIAWDIYVYVKYGPKPTESRNIQKWAYHFLFLPYGFGVLMGHFFLNMPHDYQSPGIGYLVIIGMAILFRDIIAITTKRMTRYYHVAGALILGLPSGMFLWPQHIIQ